MLGESETTELRSLLEAERDRILGSARGRSSLSRDRDRNRIGGDSVDESAEEQVLGTELVLADRDAAQLRRIYNSLARLDQGILDECEDCGEPIAFARLRVRPGSTVCVSCQEDRESE